MLRHGRATAVAVGAVVLYALVVLSGSVDPQVRTLVDDAGSSLAALVVAGLALLAARAQSLPRLRASWALLGAGVLVWGVTDAYWTWMELVYEAPPVSPSLADVGYLAMVPPIFVGILLRPSLAPRIVGRRILLIDAGLAISALLAVAWVLVLEPTYQRLGTDPLLQAIALASPLGDLVILCCLVIALLRESDRCPATMPLLLGLGVMAAGDATYGLLVVQGAYYTGHPVDVVWFAALALLGLSAVVERVDVRVSQQAACATAPNGSIWRLTTPTALLVLATLLVWAVSLQRAGALLGVAEAALVLAWALLVVRVFLSHKSVADSQLRERRLRVGHAATFRREQHRRRQLEAVRDVTNELTRELDLTHLLTLITRRAAGLVDAPMGAVFLWDPTAEVLVPRAWHGYGPWFGSLALQRGQGAAGHAVERGQGVIVNDYPTAREAFQPLLAHTSVSAVLATPIRSQGHTVGAIVVADERVGRSFEEPDLSLLSLFADQAAVAIEHARLVDEASSVEALRELARLKTELLSTVSHELRTPLTLIHGYAELLNARAELLTPGDVEMMADEILLGSRTMIRLVDDLLDFSRMEGGRIRLERASVDVADLLRRHVHAWRTQSGGDRLQLDVSSDLEAFADSARLDQIIRNLISNALSHAPTGPVVVTGDVEPSWVRLAVEDRGPGIPADELPRIWDSFFRGERARNSPNRGSGLGLAVVRQLVELHGGRVEAESLPGQGTTFRIWLPRAANGSANHVLEPDKTVPNGEAVMVHSEVRSEGE